MLWEAESHEIYRIDELIIMRSIKCLITKNKQEMKPAKMSAPPRYYDTYGKLTERRT